MVAWILFMSDSVSGFNERDVVEDQGENENWSNVGEENKTLT